MIYELALVGEKVKKQQIVALHLIIVFCCIVTGTLIFTLHYAAGYIAEAYQHMLYKLPAKWVGGLILIAGLTLLYFLIFKTNQLIQKNTNRVIRIVELVLMLFFAGYSLWSAWYLPAILYAIIAATVFFALYWETVSDPTLYVNISESGIKLPVANGKRHLPWRDIEQVIFRFGILTINCYDNRLYQWNVQSINFQKDDFRQFCDTFIAMHKGQKQSDSWN